MGLTNFNDNKQFFNTKFMDFDLGVNLIKAKKKYDEDKD
jgi:hypothetical protein